MCSNPATKMLIDGPNPDDYTLACDEHEEAMKSDTHVGTWPFSGGAPCCYLGDERGAMDEAKRRLYQRYSKRELIEMVLRGEQVQAQYEVRGQIISELFEEKERLRALVDGAAVVPTTPTTMEGDQS